MRHDSYKDWEVSGFTREAHDLDRDGNYFPLHYRELVTVIQAGPQRFEVVLGEDGQIRELTISGVEPVTPEVLRMVPTSYLAAAARGHLEAYREGLAQDGHEVALTDAGEVAESHLRKRSGPPSPEEFADQWHRTAPSVITADGQRITRRQALADHYGVTPWAIDKWSRRARDQGLITKDRQGSPRKKKAPGGTPSPGSHKQLTKKRLEED